MLDTVVSIFCLHRCFLALGDALCAREEFAGSISLRVGKSGADKSSVGYVEHDRCSAIMLKHSSLKSLCASVIRSNVTMQQELTDRA